MIRKILLIVLGLAMLNTTTSLAQTEIRNFPMTLKPQKELNHHELEFVKNNFNYSMFKALRNPPAPVPSKDKKSKILNSDLGLELINCSNKAPNGQHETWIAVNPTDPNNIIATSNDSRYLGASLGYRMVAFVTTDGGKTWTETVTPKNQGIYIDSPGNIWQMTIFDPGIAFDSYGNAYYCYGFTQTQDKQSDNHNGVFVAVSTDKGMTWSDPYYVILENDEDNPFHDRYTIATDLSEESPYKDKIYITWVKFDGGDTGIMYAETDLPYEDWEEGEQNFYTPELLPGGEVTNASVQSPIPITGPDGTVYVVWRADLNDKTIAKLQVRRPGGTWLTYPKTPVSVYKAGEKLNHRFVLADKQNMRVSALPQIAVDCSNGPRKGWVYIVQAGKNEEGKYELLFTSSSDFGETFTDPVKIDNNELGNDMFFPSITVDKTTGDIGIIYYSSQNSEDNSGVDLYFAHSNDGVNFENYRLTPETWFIDSPADVVPQNVAEGNYYWGDYTCVAADNGTFYPLFWMPFPLNGNASNLDLYTATISNAPKAPENLETVAPDGTTDQIKLTWTDPVKTLFGKDADDFVIEIKRNGGRITDVAKGTEEYIDSGLESGKLYYYTISAKSSSGKSAEITSKCFAGGDIAPIKPEFMAAVPNDNGSTIRWKNPEYHMDGTSAYDLDKIEIYIDGELHTTVSDDLNPGEMKSAFLDLETEKLYKVKLKALTKRGELVGESIFTNEFICYSGTPLTSFSENFDDDANLIPMYLEGTWAVSNVGFNSQPNCLTDSPDDDYEGNTNTSVYFAPTVIQPDAPVFAMNYIACVQKADNEFAKLRVSKDFGKTWVDIKWFNIDSDDNFDKDYADSQWAQYKVRLDEFEGDTVLIRVTLETNPLINYDGIFIDDIEIFDDPNSVEDMIINNLTLSPNPSSDYMKLQFLLSEASNTEITVFNSLGEELMTVANTFMQGGLQEYNIDINNLNNGYYYLVIRNNKMNKAIPFVKIH